MESIIVLALFNNCENYLDNFLLNQLDLIQKQYCNKYTFEFFFLEDNSTDDTAILLESFFKKETVKGKFIKLENVEKHNFQIDYSYDRIKKMVFLRNYLLDQTRDIIIKKDFVIMLDADMFFDTKIINNLIMKLKENDDVAVISPLQIEDNGHNYDTYALIYNNSKLTWPYCSLLNCNTCKNTEYEINGSLLEVNTCYNGLSVLKSECFLSKNVNYETINIEYFNFALCEHILFQIKIKTLTGKKIMIDTSSTILKSDHVLKGSWKLSARDIVFSKNEVSCYLKNSQGKWIYNKLKFNPDYEYENINGNFYSRYALKDINLNIPKKIYQTHKSIEYIMSKFETKSSYLSWKNNKDFEHHFFNNNDCEKFIKENFEENVYKAYMKLPLNVMKADLWRYCVIYINGGIYADMDAICLDDPNILLKKSLLVLAPENDTHLCNWTFAAPPLSPVLKSIIDESVNMILNTDNFSSIGNDFIHKITGPAVFTKGIEKFLKTLDLVTYENKKSYESYNDDLLYVFKYYDFHNNIIQHLFTGKHEDGWCKERENYLKNNQ